MCRRSMVPRSDCYHGNSIRRMWALNARKRITALNYLSNYLFIYGSYGCSSHLSRANMGMI